MEGLTENLIENMHWLWIAAGIALIAAEALAPGAVLVWFGVAAILTGLVEAVFEPTLDYQLLFFSVVAVALTVSFKLWQRKHPPATPTADSGTALNRPGSELIGQVLVLTEAIENGSGRAKVADTSWRCSGPAAPAGAQVRVVNVQSGTLLVEAVDSAS